LILKLKTKGKLFPLALSTSSEFPMIFESQEEGLFNLQNFAFLCHFEIHENEKFPTGPTCHPPSATCLLPLAALRYFPPPCAHHPTAHLRCSSAWPRAPLLLTHLTASTSCSHLLSPYLFPTTPCLTEQPAYTSARARRAVALQSRSSSATAHLLAAHSLASTPWSPCSVFLCHCEAAPELCRGGLSPKLRPWAMPCQAMVRSTAPSHLQRALLFSPLRTPPTPLVKSPTASASHPLFCTAGCRPWVASRRPEPSSSLYTNGPKANAVHFPPWTPQRRPQASALMGPKLNVLNL
jgi:hypothetical protein